jgi:ADP-ribose pyrophosphatase YjhB (NUDIX family)
MHIKLLTIITFGIFSSMAHTMNQKKIILHEATGMQYTKNNFGDIFPQWHNIPSEQLADQLSTFVTMLKDETPFIIVVSHDKAAAIDSIKKAGFIFFHANNDRSEWIFKNNSAIPEPYTTVIGAAILIRNGDFVLVTEEKTRPGTLDFPGGTTDFQESLRTTAARELKEETNLDVSPHDLRLFAIINRTNINRFGANGVDHYYVVNQSKVSGNLNPNPNEIAQMFYAPLKNIASQTTIRGLSVDPATAALAKHLLDKNSTTHHEIFLDFRQFSKKEAERNHNDTMTMEFFAQTDRETPPI